MTKIFTMNADGSEPVAITDGPNDVDPSWSADGERILFARRSPSPAPGIYEIYIPSSIDGRQLLSDPNPHAPIWLVDRRTVLFQSGEDSAGAIYWYNLTTQKMKKIVDGIDPSWSADKDQTN